MPHPRTILWTGIAALILGAAILFWFTPEQYGFYPRCPIFEATGLLCPGCGGTRALAALLHGDVSGAWRLNPLVVSLLPLAAAWAVSRLCRREIRVPRTAWVGLGVAVAAFGVVRNF